MNTAVVGSSGYLAGYIIQKMRCSNSVSSILTIDRNREADCFLDLQEAERFDYCVLDLIDYVIFTAAVSSPDQCAQAFDLCWKVNVTGTSYFIKQAIQHKCRVLFFSSDAVFGDIPGEIYTEESETKARTPYGRMKKAIEDEFKDDDFFKAVRLSYAVSAEDRFMSYCLACIRNGEIAEIYHPFYRNCTTVSVVADIVLWMIHNWDVYRPFVLNAAGKELVSRVRMADELNRMSGGKLKYTISTPEESFFMNRPAITQMKSLYLQKYQITEDNAFTENIKKELEGIINE